MLTKWQNHEIPKRQNYEIPKRQNHETPKVENDSPKIKGWHCPKFFFSTKAATSHVKESSHAANNCTWVTSKTNYYDSF
jgi:hypothetical protein